MGNARSSLAVSSTHPVHPHVHGERAPGSGWYGNGNGSSPRTWGTRLHRNTRIHHLRFIPTYMGNAMLFGDLDIYIAVHPHVHGERPGELDGYSVYIGSSPRTWGTPLFSRFGLSPRRFIPTYMGNACICIHRIRRSPVHPHVHGERERITNNERWAFGSSPRTWGTLGPRRYTLVACRFIPTYMGNA